MKAIDKLLINSTYGKQDEDEDSAPVIVCFNCDSEFVNEDETPFLLHQWIVCRYCLIPCIVTIFCDEGHAHTVFYDPDETTPEGRHDMLIGIQEGLRFLLESGLSTEARKGFEREAKELERILLDEIN